MPYKSRTRSKEWIILELLNKRKQIDSSVVFINPNFTLYQAPQDKPIIFPTQVNRYLENFNAAPTKLTEKHKKLADQLLASHKSNSPFSQIPSYDYDQLQKDITCSACHSFSVAVSRKKYSCNKCQHEELLDEAILRSIKEFRALFPTKKMTTNIIHDWCNSTRKKNQKHAFA